jgi:membrane associated rhomboid family serine protease
MFLPYRARISLYRLPLLTALVTLLCIGIYTAQFMNERAIAAGVVRFCGTPPDRDLAAAIKQIYGSADEYQCARLLRAINRSPSETAAIERFAARAGVTPGVVNGDLTGHYADVLRDAYRAFRRDTPANLTTRLWYVPQNWDVGRMLTAAVAHGSWDHLIGNLFFFFAFAATVEVLLGPVLYLGVLLVLALGTHATYSLATVFQPEALPTLGLSGVVMGIIALFTYFLPRARIQCFLWLVVIFRRIAIPAWILATWFIGWDLYSQFQGGAGNVNLIAHLSGAALGLLLGVTVFRAKRHWARELVET